MSAAALLGLGAGIYSCAHESGLIPGDTAVNQAALRARKFLETETEAPSLPDTYFKANGNSQQTRTEMVSLLNDAIEPDWQNARVWEFEQDIVTEVPVLLKHKIGYRTLIRERGDTVSLATQAPHTRIRVIERADSMFSFVITLLPDESYEGNLSLLESNPAGSDYSGITIYSKPDGTPEWGWRYKNGEIVNTLRFDNAYEDQADPNVSISMGFGGEYITRAFVIIVFEDGSTYIFYMDDIICTPPPPPPSGSGEGNSGGEGFPGGNSNNNGGGGSPRGGNGNGNGDENNNGFNHGSKQLPEIPPDNPDPDPDPEPCSSLEENKANPVVDMEIKPTASGNLDNGDYLGRNGGHKGIDLGKLGDPIYMMFEGTISRITDKWDPDMLWKDYPDQNNPSDKTGNRVEYTCVVNGKTIYIQCWHMNDISNIIVGGTYPAGTLLGHVGQTGNATAPGSGGPHLHLQIRENNASGTLLNPHDYIYSNYTRNANGNLQSSTPNNPC